MVDSSWGLIRLNKGHLVKSTMVGSLQVWVKNRLKDIKLNPWAWYWAGLQRAGRSSEAEVTVGNTFKEIHNQNAWGGFTCAQ